MVQSVVKFLDDVKPEFEPIATGSPTLPQDALNPLRIQPYGYYGSFTPKPQESTQLWVGNMNKYHIFNGELYNASKTIRLIKADGSLDAAAKGLWTDEGMKGQLPLGLSTDAADEKIANQDAFMNDQAHIIVATSAFGMGVDKKDVGLVVHYDISDSLENYVQEAGRAGRDPGLSARTGMESRQRPYQTPYESQLFCVGNCPASRMG